MCIFTDSVRDVSTTNIFLASLGGGIHATVYEMEVETGEEVAMILPVPVKPDAGEGALQFVNLQHYPDFFNHMERLFPASAVMRSGVAYAHMAAGDSFLKVHEVGDYVASYVPSIKEFARLDERFRISSAIWKSLPDYEDFAFAVFQLKPGNLKQKYHPMAFKYPAARTTELFFPTVHVHDRTVPRKAKYDHMLYFQQGEGFGSAGWREARYTPTDRLRINDCAGLVRSTDKMQRLRVDGPRRNADYVLMCKANDGALRLDKRGVRAAGKWKNILRRICG